MEEDKDMLYKWAQLNLGKRWYWLDYITVQNRVCTQDVFALIMGNYLAVDSKSSTLREFVGVNLQGIRMLKQPASPQSLRHHLKVWRVCESGAGIQYEPVTFQPDELSSFSFLSTEAYVVLLTSRLPEQPHTLPLPVYFWATLQSTDSLTPESLSHTLFSVSHQNFGADLYLFKGKWIKPPISITALGLAYEIEGLLKRGGQHLLSCIFRGMYVERNRVQHSELLAVTTKDGEIPNSGQLVGVFGKKKMAVFDRLYPKQEKRQEQPQYLPMNQKIDYLSKFKFKETPKKVQQLPLPKSKPKFDEPFQVEITQIMQHHPDLADHTQHIIAQQLAIDDFERELEQSLAIRQGNRLEPDIDEEDELVEEAMNYADVTCQKIIDGLFISGEKAAYNIDEIKKNNITLVINVAADCCMNKFKSEVTYLSFFAKDSQIQNIQCLFYKCIEAIEQHIQNKGAVLVHCVRGVSRSASVVTAYLIYKLKLTYEKAEKLLRSKRPQASPNNGFMLQLINFDKRVNNPYEKQPFKPKVFGLASYQKQSPKQIVAKHIVVPLYTNSQNGLDSRGYFVVQHSNGIYLWKGSKCLNPESYLNIALQQVRLINKYERSNSQALITIQQSKQPEQFWKILNLPGRPTTFSNSSLLYLPLKCRHIPAGILNPQELVFKLGSSIPLSNLKLTQDNFYLRCKQTKDKVVMIMWEGSKWERDEHAKQEFLYQIRDLYYGEWEGHDIMLHQRDYQFSESFNIETNL